MVTNRESSMQDLEKLEESTAGPPDSIRAIDKISVHRICSGQVSVQGLIKQILDPHLVPCSSGSRNFGEGGPRNMKYKPPCLAAIFFGLFLQAKGGAWPPWAPPPWIRYCLGQLLEGHMNLYPPCTPCCTPLS